MKRSMKTTMFGLIGGASLIGLSVLGAVAHGAAVHSTAHVRAAVAAAEVAEGVIEKIDLNAREFVLAVKEEGLQQDTRKTITFKTNDETVFTLDGMSSSMDEALKIGREAVVTHESNVASRVDVWSEPEN